MSRYPRSVPPLVEPDPWDLTDNAYDVNQFHTTAGKDSESPRVRISTKQLAVIAEIVASREVPEYKTTADVIRDALYHRLYFYAHHYQRPDISRMIRTESELERSREEIARSTLFEDAIKSFRDEFALAQQQRNKGGANRALDRVQRLLDSEDSEDSRYNAELVRLQAYMKDGMESWA